MWSCTIGVKNIEFLDMKCCHGESIYSRFHGCVDSRLTKLGFLTDAFKLGAVFVVIFYGRGFLVLGRRLRIVYENVWRVLNGFFEWLPDCSTWK